MEKLHKLQLKTTTCYLTASCNLKEDLLKFWRSLSDYERINKSMDYDYLALKAEGEVKDFILFLRRKSDPLSFFYYAQATALSVPKVQNLR